MGGTTSGRCEQENDRWFQWLMDRRQGGSEQRRQVLLERLVPVRDAVLAHAAVAAGETVLDIGAGDGLIAFGAVDLVGATGTVIFSDVSTDLLDHCAKLAADLGVERRCRFIESSADDLSCLGGESVEVVTTRSVLTM
jgi:ubiquinone/menaquinone biosynthesis C-methylase UbiE